MIDELTIGGRSIPALKLAGLREGSEREARNATGEDQQRKKGRRAPPVTSSGGDVRQWTESTNRVGPIKRGTKTTNGADTS